MTRACTAQTPDLVEIMAEIMTHLSENQKRNAAKAVGTVRLGAGECIRKGGMPLDLAATAVAACWDNGEITDEAALMIFASILGGVEELEFNRLRGQ